MVQEALFVLIVTLVATWTDQRGQKERHSRVIIIFQLNPKLVEVKTGETYNGTLQSCDMWMNLHLTEVILTSAVGM